MRILFVLSLLALGSADESMPGPTEAGHYQVFVTGLSCAGGVDLVAAIATCSSEEEGASVVDARGSRRRDAFVELSEPGGAWIGLGQPSWPATSLSVALDGDLAVVGVPSSRRAQRPESLPSGLYVFRRRGGWERVQVLPTAVGSYSRMVMRGGLPGPLALDVHGDLAVAGVPHSLASWPESRRHADGAVTVFRRSPIGWIAEARLRAPVASSARVFGLSVAIGPDARSILVGAPWGKGPGAAFAFTRDGSTWRPVQRLDPQVDGVSTFAAQVAWDGDRLLVSNSFECTASSRVEGAIHPLISEYPAPR